MKLIIDIPEDLYKWICEQYANSNHEVVYNAVKNGMPYEERPQGEWKVYGRQGGIPITDKCSNCKYEMMRYRNKYNYCPNCGAKMKGGAE